MKKLLAVLLVLVMVFPLSAVYAADITTQFDFEADAFKSSEPTQDPATFGSWITFNQWETTWTASRFTTTDTWLAPATRGTGTALRMYTNDGTTATPAAAGERQVFLNRGYAAGSQASSGELWISFDWLIEDYNAVHKVAMYLDNVYADVFAISMAGALTVLNTDVGITINPNEWHSFELCMTNPGSQWLFYMDGTLIHVVDRTTNAAQKMFLFMQEVQDNGSGKIKGSAMQLDNLKTLTPEQPADKRVFGLKNEGFSEGADNSSVTFAATPYNVSGEDKPYVFIMSVYDETGRYVGFESTSGTLASGGTEAPVSVTVNQWGEGYTAKVHILNSWTNRTGFLSKLFTYTDVAE